MEYSHSLNYFLLLLLFCEDCSKNGAKYCKENVMLDRADFATATRTCTMDCTSSACALHVAKVSAIYIIMMLFYTYGRMKLTDVVIL